MAARTGMVLMIAELRNMTSETDATDDNYWSDDDLQDVLDTHSRLFKRIQMQPLADSVGGEDSYTDYEIDETIWEWIDTDTIVVEDSNKTIISSGDYTYTRTYRLIEFDTDTDGDARYISGRSFDINAAAAEVWGKKAGFRFELHQWQGGTHKLREDQIYQHCLEMQKYFRGKQGITASKLQWVD